MAEDAKTHSYEEFKYSTVAQLREIAKGIEHEVLKGYTQLNKDHLITALCKALNIATHAHHEAHGIDKAKFKVHLKELKRSMRLRWLRTITRSSGSSAGRRSLMHRIRRTTT